MEFKLFTKFASLEGLELWLLIGAASVFCLLLFFAVKGRKETELPTKKRSATRTLVYGSLSLTLSFVLSYFKLFSMPFGGSITLLSMLPLTAYACWFGPAAGFLAGLAYSLLQMIQGVWVVHWVQFFLDYLVAFTVLGAAGFFPKKFPLGMAVGGTLRLLVSTVSGAVFFGESGLSYGIANPWVYSFLYNGLTIGIDTVLCVIAAAIPAIGRTLGRIFSGR